MEKVEEKRVCVTGASGYIASWIVKLLLERGYIVHGTVRSLHDPTKIEHLLAMEGASTRLHLFEANLLEEGSFDSAIHGCCGVFHTASPVIAVTSNPQEDLINPALKGTQNVLASCAKAPSVKRVILTSSIAAVMRNGRPRTTETVVDETWFSTLEFCKGFPEAGYVLSKTLAEAEAWRYAKDNDIDMISIIPTLVIGPMLQSGINVSSYMVLYLVNGESDTYDNETLGWVHVKDVAEAHIRAFEIPSANGRYIINESVAHISQVVDILREFDPNLKVPSKDDQPFEQIFKISKDKASSLGIEYTPLKVALKETVENFKQKKLIT